ncbi:hypothetical protein LTR62_003234 [Meristemomyces frigidus]|uniref:Up-regulated during septation protein 1 domain-containing protein n=1 Tax=Meristemomyces frigidus TaxID=1508187 RepID=A0AAN7TQ65_9PEZI|nr:hypothetical protein LTR62_003234 [Meristemomyces frigidus]
MPRIIAKVQGASNKTRWTLAQDQQNLYSTKDEGMGPTMDTNGGYRDRTVSPLPRYESFDGSQYSVPGFENSQTNGHWKQPPQQYAPQLNGHSHGHFEDFNFNTPVEERASHQISLNTRVRSQNEDVVGQHLLYENAMLDSETYEMLDISDVDALKKEHARLNARLDAANRKLVLECKVKEAALSLSRLYSNGKGRPDTPQSPDSPKQRSRSSLLGGRGRTSSGGGSGQTLSQAEDELAVSTRKAEDLNGTIKLLLERKQFVERKLLKHTAAVLAEQSARATKQINGRSLTNGHSRESLRGGPSLENVYSPDEFDGIRDILHGAPANAAAASRGGAQKVQEEQEQHMATVQARLEHLNEQLRLVIGEASRVRGVDLAPEGPMSDEDQEKPARLNQRLDRLEDNVQLLAEEQEGVRSHYARLQDSAHMTRNAVEEQLADVNHQVHNTLLLSADMQNMESLREPPQATGHGYQQQLQYLAESLKSMEQIMRQHRLELDGAREAGEEAERTVEHAHGKANEHKMKVDDYEATLGGLWEILQSDHEHPRRPSGMNQDVDNERGLPSPGTPLREDFSLQAFSSHVQHLYSQQQSSKEQHDILKRQIQQQRELNGKSDAEKDRQITDLQGRHDTLASEHANAQNALSEAMAARSEAETEVEQARLELMNTGNEFEGLKKSVEARIVEREGLQRSLVSQQSQAASTHARIQELEEQLEELTGEHESLAAESEARAKDLEDRYNETAAQLKLLGSESQSRDRQAQEKHNALSEQLTAAHTAREEVERRHGTLQSEMQDLESEVVRLTTELTMAKAELDGAYGSRAERAKEAQAAELDERNRQMADELARLQGDHEGLRSVHASTLAEMETMRHSNVNTAPIGVSPEHAKNLEAELRGMTDAFQDLTKESVELEKERGQLEDLIDSLRERCDELEGLVGDEKVRMMGIRSPGGVGSPGVNGGAMVNGASGRTESTSTTVLRQEFKRMIRETRAEGVKLLRAEQTQRRQLEAEVRKVRQAGGPLDKAQTPQAQPQQPQREHETNGHSNEESTG